MLLAVLLLKVYHRKECREMEALRYHTALDDLVHNFSRHHDSLRVGLRKL
jgi:hypothetical protein